MSAWLGYCGAAPALMGVPPFGVIVASTNVHSVAATGLFEIAGAGKDRGYVSFFLLAKRGIKDSAATAPMRP